MRIGLIVYGDPEKMTGGFLYDRMLVRHLRLCGDTVEIASLPWMLYGRALFYNASPFVEHELKHFSPDLLLIDELCHPALFSAIDRLRHILGCPVVSIVHHLRTSENHPVWFKRVYEVVENKFLSAMDGFIFNSNSTCNDVVLKIGDTKPCIIARPGGDRLGTHLDDDEVIARAMKPGTLDILYVGALIPRKGLHHLITALSGLEGGTWNLTVVGSLNEDKRYVKAIHKQISALGLSDRISLQGEIDDQELIERMRNSQVLAVPSFWEGFGIVYLEGMGFGLPAMASASGGSIEIIKHGVNGYLVPYGDTQSLSQYLAKLIQDRNYLAEMSLAARHTYRHHPTWEDTGRTIGNFLHHFK